MSKKQKFTPGMLIKRYFGPRPNTKSPTADFLNEMRALTEDAKLWFAREIATVTGISQDECDFPLTAST